MVRGDKPSGYGVTFDSLGRKIEFEFRQCAHCQFTWQYIPGSGRRSGLCTYCVGLLCTKCTTIVWRKTDKRCLPFYDTALDASSKYYLDFNTGIFMRK